MAAFKTITFSTNVCKKPFLRFKKKGLFFFNEFVETGFKNTKILKKKQEQTLNYFC